MSDKQTLWPEEKAKAIRMVVLDVDGVLTDGIIQLDNNGVESKRFYVRDGLGIRLLLQAGIQVGLITARQSSVVSQRAAELSLSFVHQGARHKWPALQQELHRAGLQAEQCLFMGDDLVDLAALCRVGLATAPRDADPEVLKRVDWVASLPGGRGAVREMAERLLRSQGVWDNLIQGLLEGVPDPRPLS
ncbi:KdsC family phosphatase [Candidatus Magnetaquicoccus inordinatus]|uniref:KdsC family phosphatase n=1 Tax=Candidatus Magnetaquicoccus inordinatus TaxID=2496818 RepID=UPI00102B775E|nr:HAD hydrolase family protein [Candidatus Magnetaquicoccus inordinatus]